MTRYYKVYLYSYKDNIPYKYETICTRVPFSTKLFKEIITDRIIYPYNWNKGLIYEHIHSAVRKTERKEVKTWLQSMNREKIQQHMKTIKTIEEDNLQYYEEMKQKLEKEKLQLKNNNKSVKKMLREIKTR